MQEKANATCRCYSATAAEAQAYGLQRQWICCTELDAQAFAMADLMKEPTILCLPALRRQREQRWRDDSGGEDDGVTPQGATPIPCRSMSLGT
uniref:Uncharacterized protein n=1 Tax=Oryza glumipatula TaxID=40148 RepID=A0A0D9ZIU0_9ORYZ